MPCAVYKITSSCDCHSPLVFHQVKQAGISPLILFLLLFKFTTLMQHFLSVQFTVGWEVKPQPRPWRVDSQTSQCLSKHLLLLPFLSWLATHGKLLSWRTFLGRKEARTVARSHCGHLLGRSLQRTKTRQPQRATNQAEHICMQSSPSIWGWGVKDLCPGCV